VRVIQPRPQSSLASIIFLQINLYCIHLFPALVAYWCAVWWRATAHCVLQCTCVWFCTRDESRHYLKYSWRNVSTDEAVQGEGWRWAQH